MDLCSVPKCSKNACGLGLCLDHYLEHRDKNRYKKGEPILKHGMRRTKEYKAWSNMKSRCYRRHDKSFNDYGGRGVRVCDQWIESFQNFYADMGPMPRERMQVDRVDNSGNYEPGNCRWATARENDRHKRGLKLNEHKAGVIKVLLKMGIKRGDISKMTGVTKINIAHVSREEAWGDITPGEKEYASAHIIASEYGLALIEEPGNDRT